MIKFVLAILLLFSGYAVADGEISESDTSFGLKEFLFMEGIIAVNSALAVPSPEVFGTALVLFSPLAMSEHNSKANNYVTLGGAVSLGLYNALELKESTYSDTEVFMRNMVGWHLAFASIWLSDKLIGDKQTSAYIAPRGDGFVLAIDHQF